MKIEKSLILHFRYKGAEYKVTDDTGSTIKDYSNLIATGIRIKAEHDRNYSETPLDSLKFSYVNRDKKTLNIFSDDSLTIAFKEIRHAFEQHDEVIKIDI